MKTLIVCIALLLGSVSETLFAQKNASENSDDSKLTVYPFTSSYERLLEPTTLEVKLSKGNALLLVSRDYAQSKLLQRPDSLVRLFWDAYGEVLEQLPDNTDGTSVRYVLDREDEPYVLWRKYPPTVAEYAVLDKELVRVKSVQDTLQITVRGEEKQVAELYLIVNDLRDVPQLFDELRLKTAYLVEVLEQKYSARKLERSKKIFASYRGDRNMNIKFSRGVNSLEVNVNMSLGYSVGQWIPAQTSGFSYQIEGKAIGPRFEVMTQNIFNKNADGRTTLDMQQFISVGVTRFSKPRTVSQAGTRQIGYATVGYLTTRAGSHYEPHTWRVGIGYNLSPRISIEGEFYIGGFFKTDQGYGLRAAFSIF